MPKYDYYKKKVNKGKIVKDLIMIYIVAVFLVLLFNSLFLQAFRIPSNSMEPNLKENNRIIVNKFIYGPKYPLTDFRIYDATKNINRGDVVVFMSNEFIHKNIFFRILSNLIYTVTFSLVDISNYFQHFDSNIYIKRIIGIPNDKIKFTITNGKVVVLINGIPEKKVVGINYGLIDETENNSVLLSSMILQNEYTVKEGEFYVLGDNRLSSSDSRIWGSVTKKQIIGKAILRYWPSNQFGIIK